MTLLAPTDSTPHLEAGSDLLRSSPTYRIGTGIPGFAKRHRNWAKPVGGYLSALGSNHGKSTLYGAAGGALLGSAYGAITGKGVAGNAAAGAGIGAGLSAVLSLLMKPDSTGNVKRSFYGTEASPMETIQSRLFRDPNISTQSKSLLMSLLPNLSFSEASQLSSLLHASAGAGVGFVIAKYLLGLGFAGTALMSILGGYVGFGQGGLPKNVYGERVDTSRDSAGQRRFVL